MNEYDYLKLCHTADGLCNSAYGVAQEEDRADKLIRSSIEQKARHEAAILQTAENSGAQVNLLKNQLQEVQKQNVLLENNYQKLNSLYEQVKQEAEENKAELQTSHKATRKANRLSILAIVLSTVLSISGIVASILIALYL